jgi:hypothetical protein
MAIIVKIKNKKQEKAVTDFLNDKDIEFQNILEEDAAVYKTTPKKTYTTKEKKILKSIGESVDFVKQYRKGKTKAKSFNQLMNEL